MKKAFSLFTPLVGTSVIVIAILVSAAMVQNDIMLSRGLTASYEQTNQVIASKAIKAAAGLQMLQNMETQTEKVITSGLVATCSGSDCSAKLSEAYFTKSTGVLRSQLIAGAGGLYDGVVESIKTVSSYEPVDSACNVANGVECNALTDTSDRFDCCLSKALAAADSNAITAAYDANGKLSVKIQSSYLQLPGVIDGFSVDFQNSNNINDKITLSVVPNDFSYLTKTDIRTPISKTANAASYLKSEADNAGDPAKIEGIKTTACIIAGNTNTDFSFYSTGPTSSTLTVQSIWPVTLSTGSNSMSITYRIPVPKSLNVYENCATP